MNANTRETEVAACVRQQNLLTLDEIFGILAYVKVKINSLLKAILAIQSDH